MIMDDGDVGGDCDGGMQMAMAVVEMVMGD